jgi:serine/threonine protein kinase
MVMERLGPNLETLFAKSGRRFRIEVFLGIAVQLVERIEFIHSRGFLHRSVLGGFLVVTSVR